MSVKGFWLKVKNLFKSTPDWEERRYETAQACLYLTGSVKEAIQLADEFLEELKKTSNK